MLIDTEIIAEYVEYNKFTMDAINSMEQLAIISKAVVKPELCKCPVPQLPVGFTRLSSENVKCVKCNHLLQRAK